MTWHLKRPLLGLAACCFATRAAAQALPLGTSLSNIPIGIKSIASVAGDGCPARQSVTVASTINTSNNVTLLSVEYSDIGPHMVMSTGVVAVRRCELQLELDMPAATTAIWAAPGFVRGQSYQLSQAGASVEVTTRMDWSWGGGSIVSTASRALSQSSENEFSGIERLDMLPAKWVEAFPCGNPSLLASKRLTVYQRWAINFKKPSEPATRIDASQQRAGVVSGYAVLGLYSIRCNASVSP